MKKQKIADPKSWVRLCITLTSEMDKCLRHAAGAAIGLFIEQNLKKDPQIKAAAKDLGIEFVERRKRGVQAKEEK